MEAVVSGQDTRCPEPPLVLRRLPESCRLGHAFSSFCHEVPRIIQHERCFGRWKHLEGYGTDVISLIGDCNKLNGFRKAIG